MDIARRQEIALIAVLCMLMAVIWFWAIPTSTSDFVVGGSGDISSRFVPQLATLVMTAALLIRLVRLFIARVGVADPDPVESVPRRGLAVIASMLGYVTLMQVIGFYPASAILAAGMAWFLGEQRPAVLVAFLLILLSVLYLLFQHAFAITLPQGWLGGLLASAFEG